MLNASSPNPYLLFSTPKLFVQFYYLALGHQKIEQAIGLGWKNFSILPNGEVVNADIHMKVTLGPVIGEVTQSSAVILVEVEFKDAENPTLQCQLFAKDEPNEPIQVQDLDVTNKRPISFVFEDLTP